MGADDPGRAGRSDLLLEDARRRIDAAIEPVRDLERVSLAAALDRILGRALIAEVDVPAHDNAAMDGYALRSIDQRSADGGLPRPLRIVGTARAGHPYAGRVAAGECVRILTGAVLPSDCDTVVPQERVTIDDATVRPRGPIAAGDHCRRAGEDLRAGATVLQPGRRITPADLGVAASIGAQMLEVVRRLRVAVFSTGDELRDPGAPLEVGSVRDANRYTLIGMLTRLGVDAIDLGIVPDDPAALEAMLIHACGDAVRADAIVTSGGVSAGDADHVRAVLERVGTVALWKLASRPGRPIAFGIVHGGARRAALFALPGNPVAVMVVFYALVREALLKMTGAAVTPVPVVDATCDVPLDKRAGRSEFVRGVARRTEPGWHVRTTGAQGSGILRSMSEANCLIVLDHDRGSVAAGETVPLWLFEGLV